MDIRIGGYSSITGFSFSCRDLGFFTYLVMNFAINYIIIIVMFAALGPAISSLARAFLPSLGKSIGNLVVSKAIPGITKKIGLFARRANIPGLKHI